MVFRTIDPEFKSTAGFCLKLLNILKVIFLTKNYISFVFSTFISTCTCIILYLVVMFHYRSIMLWLEKLYPGVISHFRNDWISFTQRCFVSSSVEVGQVVLKEKILKYCQCIFAISIVTCIISKGVALHLPNLNPIHPRMLPKQFSWNWPSGFIEEDKKKFFKSSQTVRWRKTGEKFTWVISS